MAPITVDLDCGANDYGHRSVMEEVEPTAQHQVVIGSQSTRCIVDMRGYVHDMGALPVGWSAQKVIVSVSATEWDP